MFVDYKRRTIRGIEMDADAYCECGQYLTKYVTTLGRCFQTSIRMVAVPCPAKDCNRTYTINKTEEGKEDKEIKLMIQLS